MSEKGFTMAFVNIINRCFRHKSMQVNKYRVIAVLFTVIAIPMYFLILFEAYRGPRAQLERKESIRKNGLIMLGENIKSYSMMQDGNVVEADKWCDLLIGYRSTINKNDLCYYDSDNPCVDSGYVFYQGKNR